jgi:DNA-binding transcriptional LysR family regulator
MNTFDWNLVRTLLATLEQGSLLGAARVLQLSQPTAGRHIGELERQLGVMLFERTGRGLEPTATALLIANAARSMEQGAQDLSRALRGEQSRERGTVRISASIPVAARLMPPMLARMRQALPDVQVELVASNAVSNLLRREADIAVRMVRPNQGTLIARKIADVRIGAFASVGYLARRGTPRKVTDLLRHDLIAGDTDETVLQGFKAMGHPIGPEAFVLRCDDMIVQWQSVVAGVGIGFAAEYMAHGNPEVAQVLSGVVRIPSLPMWLVVHREIRTNPRMRSVYDFLAAELPRLI